ncbi:MAG: undecaprenyl-phosphate glucose phosphotransferase [Rikenellaceae bacterium]
MNRANDSSNLARWLVILGEIAILNLLFYLFLHLSGTSSTSSIRLEYIFITLSYLLSVLLSNSHEVLFGRSVRSDQIVSVQFGNIVRFVFIWLSVLAVLEIVYYSYWFYMSFFIAVVVSFVVFRLLCRSIVNGLRMRGRNSCRVLYVGISANMTELYAEMMRSKSRGFVVVGYFDIDRSDSFPSTYLGTPSDVVGYLSSNRIDALYCSLPSSMSRDIAPIILYCERHLVRYYSVPNLRNYLQRRVSLEMFGETPILSIRTEPLSKVDNRILKRTFDILFSSLILLTLFPIVYVVFGTLIKLTSRGGVLFRQRRHGINGVEFWCYKFRSMRENSASDDLQTSECDTRKTAVGDFMRRHNIDELPQFINVLRGDMSVVGPRPHMLRHTKEYSHLIDTYMVRHYVKPGVTGWAQVTGYRGETRELRDMEGRIRADIWYMEHWTFTLDLLIIYKTIYKMFVSGDEHAY